MKRRGAILAGFGLLLGLGGGCYGGLDVRVGETEGVSQSGGPDSNSNSDSAESGGETEGPDTDDPGDPPEAGEADTRFPRLSHQQWENSVRDLLGLTEITGLASDFIADPLSGAFDNQGGSFDVSDNLWGDYQRAAESVADLVINDAAILDRISPPDTGQDAAARASEFVQTFGLRVFRRPLATGEADTLVAQFQGAAANYPDLTAYEAGVHLTLQSMLQSPSFLYRPVGGEADAGGTVVLDSYERASRLSYALWNTMPDAALFAAAEGDELDSKEGVVAQAQRMMDDPKAITMVGDLHGQLLKTDLYYDNFRDPEFYPDFDPAVAAAMETEVQMFLKDIVLDKGLGYAEVMTSTDAFINAELAPYYGLDPADYGPEFELVSLDATRRSGLLTRVGFLMSHAYQADPNPILRGAYISFELMCNGTPAVPDDVTAVEADPTRTNRFRVNAHTGPGTCGAGCHPALMNPFGFAFENYDAVGAWRDNDFNGEPIDAADEIVFDVAVQNFDNALELSQQLADSPQAHACYSKHLLEYLHARGHRERDDEALDALGERSAAGEINIREMIAELVTNDDFLNIRIAVEGE